MHTYPMQKVAASATTPPTKAISNRTRYSNVRVQFGGRLGGRDGGCGGIGGGEGGRGGSGGGGRGGSGGGGGSSGGPAGCGGAPGGRGGCGGCLGGGGAFGGRGGGGDGGGGGRGSGGDGGGAGGGDGGGADGRGGGTGADRGEADMGGVGTPIGDELNPAKQGSYILRNSSLVVQYVSLVYTETTHNKCDANESPLPAASSSSWLTLGFRRAAACRLHLLRPINVADSIHVHTTFVFDKVIYIALAKSCRRTCESDALFHY